MAEDRLKKWGAGFFALQLMTGGCSTEAEKVAQERSLEIERGLPLGADAIQNKYREVAAHCRLVLRAAVSEPHEFDPFEGGQHALSTNGKGDCFLMAFDQEESGWTGMKVEKNIRFGRSVEDGKGRKDILEYQTVALDEEGSVKRASVSIFDFKNRVTAHEASIFVEEGDCKLTRSDFLGEAANLKAVDCERVFHVARNLVKALEQQATNNGIDIDRPAQN